MTTIHLLLMRRWILADLLLVLTAVTTKSEQTISKFSNQQQNTLFSVWDDGDELRPMQQQQQDPYYIILI